MIEGRKIMDDLKTQQIETLTFAIDYIAKLIPAFHTIAEELRGNKQDDTVDLLNQAIEGLNLIIEIFNATADTFRENEEVFKKDAIEQRIQNMNAALKAHDDTGTAECIEREIIPFLDVYAKISKVYIDTQNPD